MHFGSATSVSAASNILVALRHAQIVHHKDANLSPLTGGVSSEIYLVQDGAKRFVVKRALPKLRVKDDWYADISRNRTESEFLKYAGKLIPDAVPGLIAVNAEDGWFAMDYVSDAAPWKGKLMRGDTDVTDAVRAGGVLGLLHRKSWGDERAARTFATDENFRQLRIHPYIETAAERMPRLAPYLMSVAMELCATKLALVHGDFSPKNIMISPERFVLLDAEVAWFGDPAFDAAFVLTHLHLKALRWPARSVALLGCAEAFWSEYVGQLGALADDAFEARTVRIQLCLMLARISGKSPVEYLSSAQGRHVIGFVEAELPRAPRRLEQLSHKWAQSLPSS